MKLLVLVLLIVLYLYSEEPITPIPKTIKVDKLKSLLGKELFFDKRLSKNNTISCFSCHDIYNGGTDNLKVSTGIYGQQGTINSPTVLNSVFNFKQFWNGRSDSLSHQAAGPIKDKLEMGNNFPELIEKLNKTSYYTKFKEIYKDGITKKNITDSIAEFEKTLITPNSPFDNFLNGDIEAISEKQKKGYELFKTIGCISCHHGVNIGGNHYNKFGVMNDVKSFRKGRFEVTKKIEDKYYFKVPTLRNIEQTSPYLHDGRFKNLEDVVNFMANYQLGRNISKNDIELIVEFLNSLTAKIPKGI